MSAEVADFDSNSRGTADTDDTFASPSLSMLDSVSAILNALASGDASARQITERSLDAIAQTDPKINAVTHVAAEAALATADDVDRRRAAGQPLGALAGVPIAIKDLICTTDMPTTCASRMLRDFVPPYDATVIRKLRDADAVLIGKTNMDEFAMGASNETSAYGPTRNPWNHDRIPGGSSGGSAATVAAGQVPASLGSDTGGSIRQPASHCGITGLKPTYGRVSRYGLVAFASSLDQIGPMAWSAEDVALLLETIAGYEPRDSTSLDTPVPEYSKAIQSADLRGIKIGVLRDGLEQDGLDESVRKSVTEAMQVFIDLGAEIVDVQLPHSQYWVPTYYVIAPCEASSNLSRYDGAHYGHRSDADIDPADGPLLSMYRHSRQEGFGSEVKRRIMIGTYALSTGYYDAYYNKALKVRRLIRGDYDAAFQQADLLLGPTAPTSAFALGDKLDDPIQMYLCDLYTVGANLAGIPAISIPAGLDDSGLPIGVQLQAPALEESRLLFAAAAFQSQTQFHQLRPGKP
nr:Asp-tRNA(Asn)/Glu-tRNA(Gln) amidotransferase subunit GatA [Crateriforma spongiae]